MSDSLRSALRRRPAGGRARISDRPADGPFLALGLEARPDVTDDDVRAAWRRGVAAATHYPTRRTAVTRSASRRRPPPTPRCGPGSAGERLSLTFVPDHPGRSGARWARRDDGRAGHAPAAAALARPGRSGPRQCGPTASRRQAGALASAARRLVFRVRRGRPGRLALRVLAACLAGAAAVVAAGGQPAAPALITGAATLLVLTARHDLAPPVPDHGPPAPPAGHDPAAPAEHHPAPPAGN